MRGRWIPTIVLMMSIVFVGCTGDSDDGTTARDAGMTSTVDGGVRDAGVAIDAGVGDGGTMMPGLRRPPLLPRPPTNGRLPVDLFPPG